MDGGPICGREEDEMKKDEVAEMSGHGDVGAEDLTGGLQRERTERFAEMVNDMELHRNGFREEHLEWIRSDPEMCKLSIGRDNSTLLLLAASFDCAQMLEELLATGACDAEALDSDGYSALMFAAMANDEVVSERMARALIPHCSMRGRTAKTARRGMQDVHFAIMDGNIETAKLLAEARGGGDLSTEGPLSMNSWGQNLLHLALHSQMQCEAVAWVLSLPSARLMFNSKDTDGETPWDVAVGREDRWPEVAEQLRAARACWERDDLSQDASIGGSVGGRGPARL